MGRRPTTWVTARIGRPTMDGPSPIPGGPHQRGPPLRHRGARTRSTTGTTTGSARDACDPRGEGPEGRLAVLGRLLPFGCGVSWTPPCPLLASFLPRRQRLRAIVSAARGRRKVWTRIDLKEKLKWLWPWGGDRERSNARRSVDVPHRLHCIWRRLGCPDSPCKSSGSKLTSAPFLMLATAVGLMLPTILITWILEGRQGAGPDRAPHPRLVVDAGGR
jgi:hypothetical protein